MAAPDPFDKRRVGWSVLVKDNHFTLPRVDAQRFGKRAAHAVFPAEPASHDSTNALIFKRETSTYVILGLPTILSLVTFVRTGLWLSSALASFLLMRCLFLIKVGRLLSLVHCLQHSMQALTSVDCFGMCQS